ncbi:MAG: SusC/RagA family TonB-linked outer membrane protein, partial [Muribaculaceae bacterium]|nr:SusC/RagA family TonB-linked outer membrane protein [Muribaculaceae bacterium]
MRKQLLLLLFSVIAVTGYARIVTGVVTQKSDGETIIGASVQVKGTNRGTATDLDGKYSIDVRDGEVLEISYVGANPTTVTIVSGQSVYNVVLEDDAQMLQEVVVTAYGQTQEKKKLNFAVQSLSSDQVTAGGSANFANSLQGKVAGLQVATGGGSPNSSTQVIIRAISSIHNGQNNEPLMVVDGVAIRGRGSTLADINPDDIETMTVLKGAAASALYGQEGANGVILITTKSGSRDGSIKVDASATVEISNCTRVPKLQSMFAPGSKGFYVENSGGGGWGPYIQPDQTIYDNLGDFLGTGVMQKYSVSASGGTEKFNSYASVAYMLNEGVVPKDYKNQITAFLKGQYKPSEQVTIQMSLNFVNTKSRGFGNSMSTIYNWGRNFNMADYITPNGTVNWASRYDHWELLLDTQRIGATVSPYYGRYLDKSETESNRFMLNGQIAYEPIKGLVFTGKVGYDKGYSMYDSYTVPRLYESDFDDYSNQEVQDRMNENKDRLGAYSFQPSRGQQLTLQFFANYTHTFAEDFNFNIFYGMEYRKSTSVDANMGAYEFKLQDSHGDGFYSWQNLNDETYRTHGITLYHTSWNKYGYFGEVRFDYKGIAQISGTWRHDGSSRFKQNYKTSYFYPSVTAGVI